MKAVMAAIVAALRGDVELSRLLGATSQQAKVFPMRPPTAAVYPCITYYLLTGLPHQEIATDEDQTYSIDCWSTSHTALQEIGEQVDVVLGAEPLQVTGRRAYVCRREFAGDLAEDLAGGGVLYHKATRWRVASVGE